MKMIDWLSTHFPRAPFTTARAKKAIRHLKKKEKKQLFSHDISQMRSAEGRWYESLIYECMLDVSLQTDLVTGIVRKGADAPYPPVEVRSGQNGLYYSNRGDINIRGNGQDIAEVDLLLQSSSGSVAFAEIVTSVADLKDLEEEIQYKKTLLGYMFGQVHVPFILFSSVDVSRSSIIRRLVKEPDSVLIVTGLDGNVKDLIKLRETRGIPRKPVRHPKLIGLEEVRTQRLFDYRALHELRRAKLLGLLKSGEPLPPGNTRDEIPPLVKKVLFGALYPSGIKAFLRETGFSIKEHQYQLRDFLQEFSKVVIAVDLPDYEPVLYFRLRNKKEYLKIIPTKQGTFRVESRRSQRMKGFFLWLEDIEPSVGSDITSRYVQSFIKKRT